MNQNETIDQHGNREHLHMLGCARAYFMGKHPDEWERIRHDSLEAGLDAMMCKMQLSAAPPQN